MSSMYNYDKEKQEVEERRKFFHETFFGSDKVKKENKTLIIKCLESRHEFVSSVKCSKYDDVGNI